MGYITMFGRCCGCGAMLWFAPSRVPSLMVDGQREPLCRACAERWNEIHRTSKGLPPVPILDGAYAPEPEEPEGEGGP